MKIYTKTGDDGTTGLLFGGRVPKDAPVMEINGTVDEAQAAMGVARAEAVPDSELDRLLTTLERDLYVLMAEVATDPSKRSKLKPGSTLVTVQMVEGLEGHIDELIKTEHELRSKLSSGDLTSAEENARLKKTEEALDQCWDLLRQRRAKREFGTDPAVAEARPTGEVEGYLQ